MKVRGQLAESRSLPPPLGSWGCTQTFISEARRLYSLSHLAVLPRLDFTKSSLSYFPPLEKNAFYLSEYALNCALGAVTECHGVECRGFGIQVTGKGNAAGVKVPVVLD